MSQSETTTLRKRFGPTREALALLGAKDRSTLMTMVAKGLIPAPVRVSPRRFLWDLFGIEESLIRLQDRQQEAARAQTNAG